METVTSCPLGSQCEEAKDGKVYRCAWYQKYVGTDAQGNDHDDNACAIAWTPMLLLEVIQGLAGNQAATESFRNEVVLNTPSSSFVPGHIPIAQHVTEITPPALQEEA